MIKYLVDYNNRCIFVESKAMKLRLNKQENGSKLQHSKRNRRALYQ